MPQGNRKMPSWEPVESSAVEAVAYNAARRELYVRFTGGAAYTYLAVPPSEFAALERAESKGIYVNTCIKPRYRYRPGAPI